MTDAEKQSALGQDKGASARCVSCFAASDVLTGEPADDSAAAKLWAVYVSEAEKYDKSLVESWRSDMEGILIFVRCSSPLRQSFR